MAKHFYKYGIYLNTDVFCNLDSFDHLIKEQRVFYFYKWDEYLKDVHSIKTITRANGEQIKTKNPKVGGWVRICEWYPSMGWRKWESEEYHDWKMAMKPMHLLFRGKEDLIEWMGEDNFTDLVINLI